MKKTELIKLIRESVATALQELDRGDIEMHQSANADAAIAKTYELADAIKGLAQALKKKGDPGSLQILTSLNTSLSGFVNKVTQAVRTGKIG